MHRRLTTQPGLIDRITKTIVSVRCLRNISRDEKETMKRLFSVREGAQGRPKAQRPTGRAAIGRCLSCIPALPFSPRPIFRRVTDLDVAPADVVVRLPTEREEGKKGNERVKERERGKGRVGDHVNGRFFVESARTADVSATLL